MDKNNPVGTGSFSMNRKTNTTIGTYSHAEGYNTTASGNTSHAEGYVTTASGNYSHSEGYNTTASGNTSHAEGYNTTASSNYSHAEGYNTTASHSYSHAEGDSTTASGYASHAEGADTIASSSYSHAEGYDTTASGYASHASGAHSQARGSYSSAMGLNVIAQLSDQKVSGRYNIPSSIDKYVVTTDVHTKRFQSNNIYYLWRRGSVKIASEYGVDNGQFTLINPITITGDEIKTNLSQYIGYYTIFTLDTSTSSRYHHMPSTDTSGSYLAVIQNFGMTSYNNYNYQIKDIPTVFVYSEDTNDKQKDIYIIGNGTSDTSRSNAHTLQMNGTAWFAGDVYVGSTSGTNKDEGSVKLATINDLPECIPFNTVTINTINGECNIQPTTFEFIQGKAYTVIWDNVEYPDLICKHGEDEYYYIGNEGTASGDYPFSIITSTGPENRMIIYVYGEESPATHRLCICPVDITAEEKEALSTDISGLATEEYVNTSIANKVTIPQDAVAGDLLTYDGTNWIRISKADLISDILLAIEESNKITFYIEGNEYHADKNMTWHDWCNSNYNTTDFGNYHESERISNADDHIVYEDEFVHGSDIIVANYNYTVRFDSSQDT